MRKFILTIMMYISISASGNSYDSLKIVSLQKEVNLLKREMSQLQQKGKELQNLYQQQITAFDSLKKEQSLQAKNVDIVAQDISTTNKKIDDNVGTISDNITTRTWFGITGIFAVIALLGFIYIILRKKISNGESTIDNIKSAQKELENAQKRMQEETVKLDTKLLDLLEKQADIETNDSDNGQPDHTLALKVADEIVRIETNLSRMDTSIKGYKHLKKAVERIRNNFMANGYEIVDMLGKTYNEGMRVVANFVSDDTLAAGEQKITGIIKPQINYRGTMIQAAQITVSQNI